MEMLEQRRACKNKGSAKENRSEDAPKEHSVLVNLRNLEVRKNGGHHKDVVERKRFLDDVTGQVFEGGLAPSDGACRAMQRSVPVKKVKCHVEQQRKRNPKARPAESLADSDDGVFLVEYAEVQRQEYSDENKEQNPEKCHKSPRNSCACCA